MTLAGAVPLTGLLDLAVTGPDAFVAACPPSGLQQVFGGQLVAQALAAADRTVDAPARSHALRVSFLRGGRVGEPLELRVERLRDGRTFSVRRVLGEQAGRPVLSLEASYARPEAGSLEHAEPAPDVPGPDAYAGSAEHDPFQQVVRVEFPDWELRRALDRTGVPAGRPPVQRVWLRHRHRLPDEPALHRLALAYVSDMTLLSCALAGWRPRGDLVVASLDHAVWFHEDVRVDDWLLYDQVTPSSRAALSLCLGRLYDRQGRLGAVVAQQGLLREGSGPG